ncbi:hypothetical protein I203_107652 [Kwoniella mangroviensis CBS 8507]|uniref:hypothetical protein n=1 Tax=Kwoniella mangroviensis CBS 8507 TaxID=1296122 RepID=UPI00080D07B1|nr:uncharacterized protein I203_02400 [Kwoniella mangroviensis CBS 8507]OCF69005.1 hypothetical protein I203_02400 [Kwoniella mangroviensis CBS 8507]
MIKNNHHLNQINHQYISSKSTLTPSDADDITATITPKANTPAGITIIPPSPSNSFCPQPIAGPSRPPRLPIGSPSTSSQGAATTTPLNGGDRDYFSINSIHSSSSSTTGTDNNRTRKPSSSSPSKHLRTHTITRSQSHYINRTPNPDHHHHRQDKNVNIPSSTEKKHSHPLKRLSIDDNHNSYSPNNQDSFSSSRTTGSDVHTPTQEYGNNHITRRRPSLSTPTSINPYTSPRSRQSSLLKSPPTAPASSSALGWLTGNRLTLPPISNKHSKSDDEREEDEEEEEEEKESQEDQTRIVRKDKYRNRDWRMNMSDGGLPKYGESSGSGSTSTTSTSTPFISMTPPSANGIGSMSPPLPVNNGYGYTTNISPPRTSILPSQAPLASPSNLQPLPQDPYNILPLSLPSSPFVSPCPSRAPTPGPSPHPSLQDLASEYATAAAAAQIQPSGSGSSPRTSISTSSSRYGWTTGRSDSRSSEEDDYIPPHSPITTSHKSHRPTISIPRSGWWQRTLSRSIDNDTSVSPKINFDTPSSSSSSRIIRFPIPTVSASKFVPTGTRNWGWLFELIQDKISFTSSNQNTSNNNGGGVTINRKNSISAKSRNRERDRLMSGHSHTRSNGGLTMNARRKSLGPNQKVWGSKWLVRIMVFVPTEPWSISLFLLFFAAFAVTLTFTLKHILNPDKEPLPWRQYCTSNYPTLYSLQDPSLPSPHINSNVNSNPSFPSSAHIESVPLNSFAPTSSKPLTLMPLTPQHPAWPYHPHLTPPQPQISSTDSSIDPVGVLIGVFTTDAGVERRHMIRQSYASHWRSRREGTEGVRIRFVMGRPRKRFEKAVQLEMEAFNDILLLDMDENMNSGKTHAFFSWAAENATVPHWEYPKLHNLDDDQAHSLSPVWKGERKPDYVVKADEDSFIMLGELEKRLRVAPRSKAFWGYLVKNTFMAGECYALSFDLVQYIHASPALRTLTRGKEDKLVAKWMNMHPEREQIVWMTERCWIYDHPKAGTVYSHGFLFPSTVAEVRMENTTGLSPSTLASRGGAESANSYSSVSKFGVAYRPLSNDMTVSQQVEALVEGSSLSLLRDCLSTPKSTNDQKHQQTFSKPASAVGESLKEKINRVYSTRPTRKERFLGDENEMSSSSTVVVHYIKKNEWFIETMVALLGVGGSSMEYDGDVWHKGVGTGLGALERRKGRVVDSRSLIHGNQVGQTEEGHEEREHVKLRKGDGL